jgi:CxxC motif-containing protein (DUF1111 family)
MDLKSHLRLGVFAFVGLTIACLSGAAGAGHGADQEKDALALGKELFAREWLHGDKRSFAGDGLGPVFNARSCVACHRQDSVGGAGPKETNTTIVSAFVRSNSNSNAAESMKQPDRATLAELHPALRMQSSFQLHR